MDAHDTNEPRTDGPQGLRPWSAVDVLTITEVAARLRMRPKDVSTWLREHDLIRDVVTRKRVIWGDVVAAMQGQEPQEVVNRRPLVKMALATDL